MRTYWSQELPTPPPTDMQLVEAWVQDRFQGSGWSVQVRFDPATEKLSEIEIETGDPEVEVPQQDLDDAVDELRVLYPSVFV